MSSAAKDRPESSATIEVADGHVVHTCCGKLDFGPHHNFCEHYRPLPRTEPADVQPAGRATGPTPTAIRVVLIIARRGEQNTDRLAFALDQLEKSGYELAAVVDAGQYLDALRMILDGLADLVVVTRGEDFPLVQHVADLNGGGDRRVRPVLRPAGGQQRRALSPDRRPRLVQRAEDPPEERPAERTEPVERRPGIVPRERRTQVIRRTA